MDHLFEHISIFLTCMLDWACQLQWPGDAQLAPLALIGVVWMELALSFMMYSQCYLPIHRKIPPDGHSFAWARSAADAAAFNYYSWNEVATQFSSMFGQLVSLSGHDILPPYVKRARVCALYRQGAGSCVLGLSLRPVFPHQKQVAEVVQAAFQKNFRTCAYNWWPPIDLSSPTGLCHFQWTQPVGSWNMLQKKLKSGTKLARKSRDAPSTT